MFETQTIRYDIKTSGLPRPEAKWMKNGEPMRAIDRVKWGNTGDNFFFSLSQLTPDDEAIYSVVFTNKLGSVTLEGLLTVGPIDGLRTPKFTQPLVDADTVKDGVVTFRAVVTGEPVPEEAW